LNLRANGLSSEIKTLEGIEGIAQLAGEKQAEASRLQEQASKLEVLADWRQAAQGLPGELPEAEPGRGPAEGGAYTAETIKNHPRVAREIAIHEPIISAAETEMPLAEAQFAKAQAVLGEAMLPEKVDVIPEPNTFNQAM